MRILHRFAAIAVLACAALIAYAQPYVLQNLRIEHPYARPTPPGAHTGAAYFAIENRGRDGDRLIRVQTPFADAAEIHSMTMDGSMMQMRAVSALDIAPHATTTLKPGGYHLMLVDLKRPLAVGDTVPLSLTFEKAGTIEIAARVEAAPADTTKRP